MKIVRLLSVACVLALLAACGSPSITAPEPSEVEARYSAQGNGTFGSGS